MKIVTPLEISIIGGETYKCNLNLVCKHPNIKFSKNISISVKLLQEMKKSKSKII